MNNKINKQLKTSLIYSNFKLFILIFVLIVQFIRCGSGGISAEEEKFPEDKKRDRITFIPIQFKGPINSPPGGFYPEMEPKSTRSKNKNLTRESAGVLVYTIHPANKKTYILMGREKTSPNYFNASSGTWNFMRGSVEKGKSYIQTAMDELYEETATLYKVTKRELLATHYDVYFHPTIKNYACTFFIKRPYVPANTFVSSARKQANYKFREMDSYEWVLLEDLIKGLSGNNNIFYVNTIDHKSLKMEVYKYSFNILKQAYHKGILKALF